MTWWHWTGVAAAAGLLALIAAELLLRARIRRRAEYYVWEPRSKLHMRLQPGVIPTQGPFVRFEVNRDGERGDEPPRDKDGLYRVLVAGGSAAECYFLDQPQSWPEVMRRELNAPERLARLGARAAHVGNIGKSLVATEFIDRILANVYPRYGRIDCLVFMVGASNVVGWLMKRTPATFDDGGAAPSEIYDVHPNVRYGWTPGRLALRAFLARKLRAGKVVEKHGAGKKLAAAREMRRQAKTILTEIPDPEPMFAHFERSFRAMLRRGKEKAARIVVAPQPWFDREPTPEERATWWHGAAGQPYTQVVTEYYDSDVVARLMVEAERRMVRICAEEGVACAPVRPMVPASGRHYYDFFHFTPQGAELVGRGLADAVVVANGRGVSPA